jgi:hypothetical protein
LWSTTRLFILVRINGDFTSSDARISSIVRINVKKKKKREWKEKGGNEKKSSTGLHTKIFTPFFHTPPLGLIQAYTCIAGQKVRRLSDGWAIYSVMFLFKRVPKLN